MDRNKFPKITFKNEYEPFYGKIGRISLYVDNAYAGYTYSVFVNIKWQYLTYINGGFNENMESHPTLAAAKYATIHNYFRQKEISDERKK